MEAQPFVTKFPPHLGLPHPATGKSVTLVSPLPTPPTPPTRLRAAQGAGPGPAPIQSPAWSVNLKASNLNIGANRAIIVTLEAVLTGKV